MVVGFTSYKDQNQTKASDRQEKALRLRCITQAIPALLIQHNPKDNCLQVRTHVRLGHGSETANYNLPSDPTQRAGHDRRECNYHSAPAPPHSCDSWVEIPGGHDDVVARTATVVSYRAPPVPVPSKGEISLGSRLGADLPLPSRGRARVA